MPWFSRNRAGVFAPFGSGSGLRLDHFVIDFLCILRFAEVVAVVSFGNEVGFVVRIAAVVDLERSLIGLDPLAD